MISRVRLLLVFTPLCLTTTTAQLSMRERNFQIHRLSSNTKLDVCRLTNRERFRNLLSPILVPRTVGSENHKRVALYLKQVMDDLGFETEWDRFSSHTPHGQKTFRNLIATYHLNAPRRLLLACHYDSKIMAEGEFIGATDSAVPCAMLLDISMTLAPYLKRQINPLLTLQVVFFDGEEAFVEWSGKDSIYGARHLAEIWGNKWYPKSAGSSFDILKELDRIDVLVLLDLLGAANPVIRNTFGHRANDLFNVLPQTELELGRLGCLHDLPSIFDSRLSYAQVEDDHVPFNKRGVPVLHLIPVPFPSVWHKLDDNGNALHYPTIDNLVSIIRVFVAQYLGLVP